MDSEEREEKIEPCIRHKKICLSRSKIWTVAKDGCVQLGDLGRGKRKEGGRNFTARAASRFSTRFPSNFAIDFREGL